MPLIILLAAQTLYKLLRSPYPPLQKKPMLTTGLCIVLGVTLIVFPEYNSYHWWLNGNSGKNLYYFLFSAGFILIVIPGVLLAKHYKILSMSHAIAYLFFTAALISSTVHGLIYRDWYSWTENIAATTSPIKKLACRE